MTNSWLVVGIVENWQATFSRPDRVWGLRERYRGAYERLNTNDCMWMYVTSPVSGVIGVGKVKTTYEDINNLIWPEELVENRVIWQLRFTFDVIAAIEEFRWLSERYRIDHFGLNLRTGFQPLGRNHVAELSRRFNITGC